MVRLPSHQRTVVALTVQFFANGFVYASLVSRLSEVRDQAGVTTAGLGLALSAGSLTGLVASFFTGLVTQHLGSKTIMILGGVCYSAALVGIGVSGSAAVLVAALVVLALFDVFVDVAMNLQASTVSARRPRPVISRLHGIWSVGSLAGGAAAIAAAQVGAPIVVHYGLVAALAVLALVVATAGLLPVDEPHPLQQRPGRRSGRRRWVGMGAAVLALGMANALAETLEIATGEWTGLRLRDDLGSSAAIAAAAFVVFTLGMTAGRLLGDHLTGRLGGPPTVRQAWPSPRSASWWPP